MRIGWRKLAAMSAVWAAVAGAGCTVEVVDGPPGSGGSGGTDGSAGAGGSKVDAAIEGGSLDAADGRATEGGGPDVGADAVIADATDAADAVDAAQTDGAPMSDGSTDGTDTPTDGPIDAASDGSLADAPDGAGSCFAEEGPDAATTASCAMLPYFATACRDDAGIDAPPAGASLCTTLRADLKVSAFQELFACLQAIPGADGGLEACSPAHEQASDECSRRLFNRSMCPVADSVVEGGVYGCTQIAASCGPDSGSGGIPVELCRAWLGPFNTQTRQGIIDCYLDPSNTGATSCRDKFENYCVFP